MRYFYGIERYTKIEIGLIALFRTERAVLGLARRL